MQLGKDINKKQFNKWIKALRSGDFTQTAGHLQGEAGYCCLGVACKVLIDKDRQKINESGMLSGELPEDQRYVPLWLTTINYDISNKQLACDKVGANLVNLNDDQGYNFDEIADVLELVYVHRALD